MNVVTSPQLRRSLVTWLCIMAAMILIMVFIGGMTRLTNSGLSMVEWQPVKGILPPIGQAEWQEEFSLYQQSPEYQKINKGIALSEFKNIFWWEYIHRIWGRIIGLAFLIPLVVFWRKYQLPSDVKVRLVTIMVGIGLQGVIGKIMVDSGLIDTPEVSPYRLTAHLMAAALLFALIVWTALQLQFPERKNTRLSRQGWGIFGWLCVAMAYGGLVAGHSAGLVYNTFPHMGPDIIPSDIWIPAMGIENLVANPVTVQGVHRFLVYLFVLAVTVWSLRAIRTGAMSAALDAAAFVLFLTWWQFMLGVFTIVLGVPVWAAVWHQVNSFMLMGAILAAIRLHQYQARTSTN